MQIALAALSGFEPTSRRLWHRAARAARGTRWARSQTQPVEILWSQIQRFPSKTLGFPLLSGLLRPAHNGVVTGSSPAGPTNLFNQLRIRGTQQFVAWARNGHARFQFRVAIERDFSLQLLPNTTHRAARRIDLGVRYLRAEDRLGLGSKLEVAGRREDDAAKSFLAPLDHEHVGCTNRVCPAILQDAALGTQLLALRHAGHLDREVQGSDAPSLGNQGEARRRCGNVACGAYNGRRGGSPRGKSGAS